MVPFSPHTPNFDWLITAVAFGALLGGCAESASEPSGSKQATDAPAEGRFVGRQCSDCVGPELSVARPGKKVQSLLQIGEELFSATTSTWLAQSARSRTMVQTGSGGLYDPDDGYLVVTQNGRYGLPNGGGSVTIRGHGPLTITSAPQGDRLVDWAQNHGVIKFRARGGITGVLRLSDKTIDLDCPGPCPAVKRYYSTR